MTGRQFSSVHSESSKSPSESSSPLASETKEVLPLLQESNPKPKQHSNDDLSLVGGKNLHPFVHWAQSYTHITLRVNLMQIDNLDIKVNQEGTLLKFSAQGVGAHGRKDYKFELDFFNKVDRDQVSVQPIERYVLLLIKKLEASKWSRLTRESKKLAWLRVDFDKYTDSDSDCANNSSEEDEEDKLFKGSKHFELLKQQLKEQKDAEATEEASLGQTPNKARSANIDNNTSFSNIFNPFNRLPRSKKSKDMKHDYRRDPAPNTAVGRRNTARHANDLKTIYLFLYNVMMFVGFSFVVLVLWIKILTKTLDDDSIKGVTNIVTILTYTQLLETIHPMLGLVPGGPLTPFTQVIGRILVNFFLTDEAIRQDAYPYAHVLMLVWSTIEIFRYSFYALHVFNVDVYPITWCRYSLFLPLYPMGGFSESMILFSVSNIYGKNGKYSYPLPNWLNISFSLPIALKIYIFLLLPPTILHLMRYMLKQRVKQLAGRKVKLA